MLFFEPKSQLSEPNPKIIVVDLLQLCLVTLEKNSPLRVRQNFS